MIGALGTYCSISTVKCCVLDMFAADVVIDASADNAELLKQIKTVMNLILSNNGRTPSVMSKFHLWSFHLDTVSMSLDSGELELVERNFLIYM